MIDVFQENPRRTALVLVTVLVVALAYLLYTVNLTLDQNDGHVGALLDDTWIHVRFADKIANGDGLSYNGTTLTAGATSPLWVLMLAAIYVVTDPSLMTQVDIAIALSAMWHVLSVLVITGFGWWLTRHAWVGVVAGILTALTGRYLWMGLAGMETTAFTTFCILVLWSHIHDIQIGRVFGWRTGILAGIATLGRPEAYLLTALIGFDAFIVVPLYHQRNFAAILQKIRAGWRGILAYGLLAGSYPIVCLLIDGHPLPNTFRAKSYLGKEWPNLPRDYFWTPLRDHGWLLVILAGIGTGWLLWRTIKQKDLGLAYPLWPSAFVLGVLFLGSQRYWINHGRYVSPSIPFHALAAAIGIFALVQLLQHERLKLSNPVIQRAIPIGLSLILGVMVFERGFYNADQVANDVGQLRKMHVAAGYWLKDHTMPDQIIALNDVGAIAHISNRRILDLEGLISPEVIDATRDTADQTCPHDLQLARLMLKEPPALIGVFPWFYPCLTSWPDALQSFNVFAITGPTVIAGGEMVIYVPIWQNWPMLLAAPADANSIHANFQDGVELLSYQAAPAEGGLNVTLWWEAYDQPAADYHIFVHLVGTDGTQISQHDGQPQNDRFLMSWWRKGDIIRDEHFIPLPSPEVLAMEGLSLRIGVYRYPEGARLLRVDDQPDQPDMVQIPLVITHPTKIFG